MSTKTGKRPLRSLSAHEKLEAIRRVHEGESKASVARDIGVPESTLRGWCKNENKISYLSRQSSPENDTDTSSLLMEPTMKEKRLKLDDSITTTTVNNNIQPFNLSLKTSSSATNNNNNYSLLTQPTPNSEALYTPIDYSKSDMMDMPKTPQNLSFKPETPKSAASQPSSSAAAINERERNRAELARLSIELGLNRPEMFNTNPSLIAEISANLNILTQWNNFYLQQQYQNNGIQKNNSSKPSPDSSSSAPNNNNKTNKPKELTEDYLQMWFKTHQEFLASYTRNLPTSTTTNNNCPSNSSLWTWPKNGSSATNSLSSVTNKPILYQQLTRQDNNDADENATVKSSQSTTKTNKVRAVLDNLLLINNNNVSGVINECRNGVKMLETSHNNDNNMMISQSEALEHGEKFMKWLESSCSDPSVTAMQIMQFRTLLNNLKIGFDRKMNGDLSRNKTKVKRK